jgi:aspartate/methionine/tyrosine aminotransferase
MKINTANVTYSSIVQIGEDISKLEKETGEEYLKLHRGVMDVTTIEINSNLELNSKKLQQYSGNDGYSELINTIKSEFSLNDHLIITPGGMGALDLIINSLEDKEFWIPNLHWGSWNKILKTHNKEIKTFDDFNLDDFRPNSGVIMLCLPSNPTGYYPEDSEIKRLLEYTKSKDITVILDLPYYHLFNDNKNLSLNYDNVIVLSSFSKSIGLSGYRIGYISTKNEELYKTLRIRSLYKYNSISTIPQIIINDLLIEKKSINNYKKITVDSIEKNIKFLKDNNLLFDSYPKTPIGPFAVVNIDYDTLIKYKISSVPLNKFSITNNYDGLSRISVAVEHSLFLKYFKNLI